MKDMIARLVTQMTHEEKLELQTALERAIAEEMAQTPSADVESCPRCGCPEFIKKGRGRKGEQRWLCRGCGRTFGAATRGLLANSKLDASAWLELARCMVDRVPLRECARRCATSLPTAWFMRHRMCEVMASRLAAFRVERGTSCQVDGTFLDEDLSGNWSRSSAFEMPREPHRNGKGVKVRGISNLKVCVVCGANDLGDSFCELSNRGRASGGDIERVLSGKIAEGSIVSTDMHSSYPRVLSGMGVAAHNRYDAGDRSDGDINMVNALHSRLKEFLAPFHGVATRRLQHYLDWFCYREQFRKSDADRREVTFADAAAGRYKTTKRGYAQTPHPFMEYWGMGATSTVV